jgi:molybdopterin-containing oxidoreductase family iron-sulfur binding subunit
MALGGCAYGLLVESHEGRPTKIEGNHLHPESLGATDVFSQAAILDLYDPDRSQTLTHLGAIRPWSAFLGEIRAAMSGALKGEGVRILTESVSSPTLAAQIHELLVRLPAVQWHQWDAAASINARAGARLAFGTDADVQLRVGQADVILALDADFLSRGPGHLRYAREFAGRRRPEESAMVRLYAVESMPTGTGAAADHRLTLRPSEVATFARAVADRIGVAGVATTLRPSESAQPWIDTISKDLAEHRGSSLVVAGETQPPVVHALAHAMNEALGNGGRTVVYTDPVEANPVDQLQSLSTLTRDMAAGNVNVLVIVGGNPVFTAPVDMGFGEVLEKVALRVHLAPSDNETSALCHWHIPEAHFLEAWSDARAFDGTVSIVQPLIAPLYRGRSAHELIAALSDRPERSAYDILREHWQQQHKGIDFEAFWRQSLHDGVIAGSARPMKSVAVNVGALKNATETPGRGIEIAFQNDPSILDGRFANNAWLQELPKPITKLTWDNAVMVSPAMAERLGGVVSESLRESEWSRRQTPIVELRYRGRSVRGPLLPVVGHPDGVVTVHLGYGRRRAGSVGTGVGFDANAIRTSDAPWIGFDVQVVPTNERYALASTQFHQSMENRDLIRAVTLTEFLEKSASIRADELEGLDTSLYDPYEYTGYKWGMAIDINACIGCGACVVACQAENNIPVVGKNEVLRGREMHWLRIDTYHRGRPEQPETFFQPVPCMHCEKAPCEVVCPVNATVHSHEGLNEMVYNRCVGTRYCSNNCPYKVRRFNFLLYADWNTPVLKLGRNPDVSVRSRGVMEKCTYCVQRINAGRIESEKQNRRIQDGEVRTACQAACPTEAIVFGDVNDPNSRVAKLKALERNYALLAHLDTRPRTTYLTAVRNVNDVLTTSAGSLNRREPR